MTYVYQFAASSFATINFDRLASERALYQTGLASFIGALTIERYCDQMGGHYQIAVYPDESLAVITIGGFFDLHEINAFAEDRDQAYAQLTCASREHVTLVDMRDMGIQTQQAVHRFATLLRDRAWQSRALAFIVEPTLARSQIARASAGRNARHFVDIDEARSWLFAGDPVEPRPSSEA